MKIAYGNSRFETNWKNSEISWEDFKKRVSATIRTAETLEEYRKMTKARQADVKDKGGFVMGHLKGGRRRKNAVLCRSALALDMDYGTPGVWDEVISKRPYRCCAYSTHKHTPEKPRLRIVIPLSRDVSEAEYPALARMAAKDIGIDLFDDSTYEAHRLMYWPSTSINGEFFYREKDGRDLDPDTLLSRYADWRDESTWPVSSRQSAVPHHGSKEVADPLAKPGVVGAFCRAYGMSDAIDTFLSDIYAPSSMENRYDYIPADSAAGLVIYEDKFAYSHHATDPVCGRLLNAFDLVRLHKFAGLDDAFPEDAPVNKLPSYKAMSDMALNDGNVKALLARERLAQAADDFAESSDWRKNLTFDKSGKLQNTLHNILLIMENDDYMKSIVFNELADGLEIKGKVPWKHPARFWRDADDYQLICYVDAHYGTFSARNYDIAVQKTADDRSYHPIREYLEGLPEWDGIHRVDTLLIDYLGAADDAYVRAVTRKALCAAVIRVRDPGTKFDTMIVLNGPQGIGKSTLIAKLGMSWFSDSLQLTDMNDKTAAEKLQGYWVHEIGELAGMKKADIDKVKAFISRTDDKYRAAFGRRVTPHPRQCIFIGTTNKDNGYLRDVTGNRRFWNVKTPGTGKMKPWRITQNDVDQIWAEALVYVRQGETLYLEPELERHARKEQKDAMEEDDREGIVREYLDTLLPENWAGMDIYQRQDFIRDKTDPTRPVGTIRRDTVSNIEIWCECFGKPKSDIRPADSYAIAAIMTRIEGWEKDPTRPVLPIYGQQRVYRRSSS